jgi:hypothetical protein
VLAARCPVDDRRGPAGLHRQHHVDRGRTRGRAGQRGLRGDEGRLDGAHPVRRPELGEHRIRVVPIALGPVAIPLTSTAFRTGLRDTLQRMATEEVAEPGDVVEVVLWVVSIEASLVAGTISYVVD